MTHPQNPIAERYAAFDGLVEGVQVIDRAWRYVYVNATVAAQGKSTREALQGHTMMEMYPGIETTEVFALMRSCMETGSVHQLINEFTFPDGSNGYFELRIQPVPEGILLLSFDVTKQKLAEKLLQQANTLLDEKVRLRTAELSAKNRELEQFVYIASHDLQEPLRTITNYLEVLDEDFGADLPADAKTYLTSMSKAALRMKGLIKAVLEYSRLGLNRRPSPVDCGQLIRHVVEDLQARIQESGAVVSIGTLPVVEGYETELRMLFQNLLSNAIKFVAPGVVPRIRVQAEPVAAGVRLSVHDNGIGIAPEHHAQLFQLFRRLNNRKQYDGVGMGLATCRRIIDMHGGRIGVESQPGQGSCFWFELPAVKGAQ